jgi:DnaJ like chaperone protein
MSFWRKIAGLAARNLDEAECDVCPPGLPGEDPAFSTAVTALGAKLAKADGDASAGEWDAFHEVFHPDPSAEGNVRRLYQLARQTTRGFEGYARRLQKRYHACPQLLEDVLDGLFYIATSDGVVTGDELTYLERVSELFGQSPLVFRRIKATHLGAEADDPYVVLGVAYDATDEAVREAWRARVSEAHPDRARARGLPQEFIEVAEAKAAAINAAYAAVMRERRAFAAHDLLTGAA